MNFYKNGILAFTCLLVIAGCSKGEQKPETTITEKSSASTATTDSATPTSTDTSVASTSTKISTKTSTEKSSGGEVYLGTINGVISDSMCGKDHSPMGDLGKDPVACSEKCIKKGAKYVLVDQKGDVYELSDQEKPASFAGKAVAITGHIDPTSKSIHVHSLVAKK